HARPAPRLGRRSGPLPTLGSTTIHKRFRTMSSRGSSTLQYAMLHCNALHSSSSFPLLLVECFCGLHDVEQHGNHLPRDCAHGTRLRPTVTRLQRQIILAIESSTTAPPSGQEEELSAQERPSTLGLAHATTNRRTTFLTSEIHPGELQDLPRCDVAFWY